MNELTCPICEMEYRGLRCPEQECQTKIVTYIAIINQWEMEWLLEQEYWKWN